MAKEVKSEEGLGISGFTLGVVSIVLAGWLGIISSIVGYIFCHIQQKRHPIHLGRIGKILNIIGFIISLIFVIAYTYYLVPAIQQQVGALG